MTSDHSHVNAQHRTGSLFIVINWVKFLRGREGIFQIKREFVALHRCCRKAGLCQKMFVPAPKKVTQTSLVVGD